MNEWFTPSTVLAIGQLIVQIIGAVVVLIAVFQTKGEVKGVRRDVDGRFSQILDLVARLSGAPERRRVDERSSDDDGKR